MTAHPTVFIVDDDPVVLESLSEVIRGIDCQIECYESAEAFLDGFDQSQPGCLVLDVRLPGMSGIKLQEQLAAAGIRLPVIFITVHGDIHTSVSAMKRGAVDFLEKPFRPQELRDSVLEAIEIDAAMRKKQAAREEIEARCQKLTPSERAVLQGIISGKTNRVIADGLDLSERTVQFRRSSIMKKMNVDSRAALVALILSTEGVSLDPPESDSQS